MRDSMYVFLGGFMIWLLGCLGTKAVEEESTCFVDSFPSTSFVLLPEQEHQSERKYSHQTDGEVGKTLPRRSVSVRHACLCPLLSGIRHFVYQINQVFDGTIEACHSVTQ